MIKFSFVVGKKYKMTSACDSDCVWVYEVISRTAQTITIKDEDGTVKKCRIIRGLTEYYGAEVVRPLGTFSMCPSLKATNIA